MRRALLIVTLAAGCGVTSPFTPAPRPGGPSHPDEAVTRLGLQYDGAVASATATQRVDISAPIFPDTRVLYAHEGGAYPASPEDRAAVARAASMTYEWLLAECAQYYPGIMLATADQSALTAEELAHNYNLVAQCSYERYGSKPYWIPQLVDDVEICAQQLGSDWRLIDEADLATMAPADFQYLASTLAAVRYSGDFFGNFYFSLDVYARRADGTLGTASLEPGAAGMVVGGFGDPLSHNEGGTVLRCIRKVPASP